MRSRTARLRVETLEDRCNPAHIGIAEGIVVSAADFSWQLQNDFSWTTADASSNGAVPYQFADGTPATVELHDAFDGAWLWGLANDGGTFAEGANDFLLYRDLNSSADVNTLPGQNNAFPAGTILTGDPAFS